MCLVIFLCRAGFLAQVASLKCSVEALFESCSAQALSHRYTVPASGAYTVRCALGTLLAMLPILALNENRSPKEFFGKHIF